MAMWLFKSEPEAWSWDDQVAAGSQGTAWTGVRNYQARNAMRAMTVGDRGLFYHSANVRAAVGIVEVTAAAHPDPSAEDGAWECVDVKAVEALRRPVTLAEVKATPALATMALVTNSRLSVQPVTEAEWDAMMALAAEPAPAAVPKPGRTAGRSPRPDKDGPGGVGGTGSEGGARGKSGVGSNIGSRSKTGAGGKAEARSKAGAGGKAGAGSEAGAGGAGRTSNKGGARGAGSKKE